MKLKALRIIFSITSILASVGLLFYSTYRIATCRDYEIIYSSSPFIIISIILVISAFFSLSRNVNLRKPILAGFILLLIAEVFNLVLVFVSVGIIPFGFMPDIDLMYLNNGITFTVNIIAICIVGIIFGAIAKRGNFVIAIIYLSLFLITQFAIILNNMWFGGVAFLIIWIACLFSFARMFVFRDREELAQKKADQLKLEAEKEAKKTEKKPAAAETKINRKRIWTENGFTYSNLP